ncbi:MAG: flagellar filament capping protein FliD [Lachnospiraceae bacterium]
MAIRLSGLSSGLDTESIVAELVKAKSTKKEKLEKEQKKFSWKQEAWKTLNSKIYSFYSKTLSDMRMTSDYSKKTTKASSSAVTVITGGSAPNCVQTMKVENMAKAGYLTGGKLADSKSDGYTAESKLTSLGIEEGSKFSVTSGGATKEIEVTGETTINDVLTAMREAGLNANFDETNQRFYISAKATGKENDFSITADDAAGLDALSKLKINEADPASETVRINGENAKIMLNGIEYESDTNTFEINGLTITVNAKTDEEITLTTDQDTEGIYNMIKNFFKEYNELINEMDKLYNAESASKYDMLSSEEKEAMDEDEVKEWENKIKDSLLRRDSTLGTVSQAMKEIMLTGITMKDGSKKFLSEFGIATLGYFNAADNEKNAYHIDGDEDDSSTGTNADKLKAAIAKNPEEVTEFFSTLTRNLYDKLGELMARKEDYSSAFTVYNDLSMKKEYDNYTSKIKAQEELIADYEDRYYQKFAKMETAMAKLNSQQSSLSSLFGS